MTDASETHYARSGDGTNLAYQVSGDGPLDLVFVHGVAIPIDLASEDPGFLRVRGPTRVRAASELLSFGTGEMTADFEQRLAELESRGARWPA
jgi:hypothetical protein